VERRQLGEAGQSSIPLLGRSAWDDVMASGIGYSLGGPGGAVLGEGVNLLRQSRGPMSVAAQVTNKMGKLSKPNLAKDTRFGIRNVHGVAPTLGAKKQEY
jgi:hypothetical protein